ncbi:MULTISPECIES: hypothetical protein [Nocardia]|uniref:hypothetical protein n=1 Tax=Nocardia TaxID=1817 RepID=UPI0007A4EA29|nr:MULTISPECIES: hypothetical protein [Nocardia]
MSGYSYRDQLPAGTRVRHASDNTPNAFRNGSATILERIEQNNGRQPEYLVALDDGSVDTWKYVHPIAPEDFR